MKIVYCLTAEVGGRSIRIYSAVPERVLRIWDMISAIEDHDNLCITINMVIDRSVLN